MPSITSYEHSARQRDERHSKNTEAHFQSAIARFPQSATKVFYCQCGAPVVQSDVGRLRHAERCKYLREVLHGKLPNDAPVRSSNT